MNRNLKFSQPLQVRVLEKNTMRAYELAARDFQQATGRSIEQADEESIAAFYASMKQRKLSVSTIRLRLSAVASLSGQKIDLPKRENSKGYSTLSAQQVRKLMSVVTDRFDRLFLMKLLTVGTKARTLAIPPLPFGPLDQDTERMLDAQQASRKIKRYARLAGLKENQVSLRVWCQSGRALMNNLGALELINIIDPAPDPSQGVEWRPLHGIGRRSKAR